MPVYLHLSKALFSLDPVNELSFRSGGGKAILREITHKTSGHELSSRLYSLYSGREAPS